MAHIQKYKSHYILALVLSLFWAGLVFALPMVREARGVMASECGNGIIEGGEVCDDGNATDAGICTETCFAFTRCGDGTLQNPNGGGILELCDDGNISDYDGCSSSCQAETPTCGNSHVESGEGCDDGNVLDGDGCSAQCAIEIPAPVCGNGRQEDTEECDDGNLLPGDGCSLTCQIEPPLPVCGNGTVEAGELCDEGALNGHPNHCDSICSGTTAALCGNGVMEAGETCDDGNLTNGDGCSLLCQIEPAPTCGNMMVETGETCDEGVLNGTPNHCNLTCSGTTASICGNATVETGETCDDGNQDNSDSCLNSCKAAACGDGFVKLGTEACDDGNNKNGDGCSALCAIEPPTCSDSAVKIIFNRIETVNAPGWKNQVASGEKTFPLTGNFVVIPLSQVEKFQSNLRNAFQVGWEGLGQAKHLRLGSMRQIPLNSKSKSNYGVELDYTVEFLGQVHLSQFVKMNTETGKETIVFNDGKIVYNGDRTDGVRFLTGNGPGDDWSKYFLTYKNCDGEDQQCHDCRDQACRTSHCNHDKDGNEKRDGKNDNERD